MNWLVFSMKGIQHGRRISRLFHKEIKKLIADGAHDLEIEEAAVKNGMRTLYQSCLGHILNGLTTIDEFVRVLGIVND